MAPPDSSQETLRSRGLRLAWFIVVWDIIEGAVDVTAGVLAGSIALVAFGLDSAIEVFAALVVIGQLHGRTSYGTALKLIAVSFFVLAIVMVPNPGLLHLLRIHAASNLDQA